MNGRYWLFAFDNYYPSGGLNDMRFAFDTVEDFDAEIAKFNNGWADRNFFAEYDFYQVVDTKKMLSHSVRRYNADGIKMWVKIHVEA